MLSILLNVLCAWAAWASWGGPRPWLWWVLIVAWIGMQLSASIGLQIQRRASRKYTARTGLEVEYYQWLPLKDFGSWQRAGSWTLAANRLFWAFAAAMAVANLAFNRPLGG